MKYWHRSLKKNPTNNPPSQIHAFPEEELLELHDDCDINDLMTTNPQVSRAISEISKISIFSDISDNALSEDDCQAKSSDDSSSESSCCENGESSAKKRTIIPNRFEAQTVQIRNSNKKVGCLPKQKKRLYDKDHVDFKINWNLK